MPISITALTATRTITIPVGEGESLTVTYRPSALGPAMEEREIRLAREGRQMESLAQSLAELIVDWDVVDEKGKPIPPTRETIGALGIAVMLLIRNAITRDALPNP